MELCIKTGFARIEGGNRRAVSILVLMELCIKTSSHSMANSSLNRFNPCFNGTIYKNKNKIDNLYNYISFQSLF